MEPLVRVFGGTPPEGSSDGDAVSRVANALGELAPTARDHGVTVVLETHDHFSTGRQVAAVLERVGDPAIAALWDLHHPYRQGEQPAETHEALRPYLRHTHVKDSRDGAYCLLGQGDVPVKEMLDLLKGGGSDALWISLEWEKRWHPEIAEPEVAFPAYARTLRSYLGEQA